MTRLLNDLLKSLYVRVFIFFFQINPSHSGLFESLLTLIIFDNTLIPTLLVSAQKCSQWRNGCTAAKMLVFICPGTAGMLPPVAILWSGAS